MDTAQAIANVFSGDSLRSVVTDNGTNFWMSGAGTNSSGGIEYVAGATATTATALTGLTNPNTRQVQIIDGNLFVGGGANTPGRSVFQVGSGLPTTGNQTLTSSITPAASAQYQSFYFADLDSTVSWRNTGFDTLYATDSNSGAVVKFSYVVSGSVGTWTARGSLALSGAGSLVGYNSSGGVVLYATSTMGTTGVSTVTDTTGYNTDFSSLVLSSLATPAVPGANYGFRGISFVPRTGVSTTTTVTSVTPATVEAGSSVTLTATVAAATGSATPTGAVQFRSGDVLLATAPITGTGATGTATVSTTSIPFGTYANVTAQYVPDGNPSGNLFNPSTSAAFSTPLVVTQPGVVTTTTLASVTWAAAPSAAAYGDTITFTGSVATADSTAPVGTLEIRDGGPTGTLLASGSTFGTGGSFTITSTRAIASGTYASMAAYFVAGSGYKNSTSATSSTSLTISQTTLGLGDIAFTGYQATGTDKITFVLLKDVIAGTTFTLADSAWTGTALAANEGTSVITLTQAFTAGTVFDFDFSRPDGSKWQSGANTANGGSAVGIQETTTTSFGLNSSGDNLFIYQGAAPTTGTASGWVAAFSSSSFLTSGVAGTDQTYLPAAFTEGVNAFSLGLAGQAANQNGGLNDLGTVTGTATGIRTTVYTLSNWTISVGNVAMPSPTVFTISSAPTATIGTSGTLAALSTVYGTASATTSITVTGSGLTGDVTATAPAGFQVSSDGTSFGGTATFTQSSGAVNGTLTVRLAAVTAVGTYSGNVTLASNGASGVNAATTSSTVTPARLTVTANDFSRLYGAANPT
ncbi:MAG: hypothetical protein EBR23_05925, partial [Planctomycetia bacterium]|nr:hypothetical protein [Planctomycetia bacterium]